MKPYIHAKISVKKFGGTIEDYMEIHDFIDSSKQCLADIRHRALLHSTFGCFMVEKVFGHVMTNSDGKEFSPRDVAENHIIEDLGTIPTVERWLTNLPVEPWMGGHLKKQRYRIKDGKKIIDNEDDSDKNDQTTTTQIID